jgi:hypothetical protein
MVASNELNPVVDHVSWYACRCLQLCSSMRCACNVSLVHVASSLRSRCFSSLSFSCSVGVLSASVRRNGSVSKMCCRPHASNGRSVRAGRGSRAVTRGGEEGTVEAAELEATCARGHGLSVPQYLFVNDTTVDAKSNFIFASRVCLTIEIQ